LLTREPRVTVISCIRLALLVQWFNRFYRGLGTRDIYYSFGWAVSPIECNLAIIAASIPALWPLFRKAFPNMFSDLNYSYRVDTQPGSTNRATPFRSDPAKPMGRTHLDDDSDDAYMMSSMNGNGHANCRATTPTGSQDGIIDAKHGIVRTTDVEIGYEDAGKDRDIGGDHEEIGRQKNVAYAL
jgi:hypothetical protein